MHAYSMIILVLASLFSISLGILLLRHPTSAIDLQMRFYKKINWKLEPVSMDQEIQNTKIMGAVVILMTLLTIFFVVKTGTMVW